MKAPTKVVFITFTLILLISSVAVLSPRAVHAVAAALVRDVDNPDRHPFSTSCTPSNTHVAAISQCATPPVPPGAEVVIDTVWVAVLTDDSGPMAVQLSYTSGGSSTTVMLNPVNPGEVGVPISLGGTLIGQQAVDLKVDPLSEIVATLTTPTVNPTFGFQGTITFTGYYVTLP